MERVFWSWNHPDHKRWEAPDNQRRTYGNSRALYKLYFTSTVMKGEETIEESTAVGFAKQMVPWINAALFGAETPEGLVSPELGQRPEARDQGPELGESLESTEGLELGEGPGSEVESLEPATDAGEPAIGEPAGATPPEGEKPEKSIYDTVS